MPNSGPADTLVYFVAGYVVFFAVSLIYLASLILRRRSLKQDLDTLEEVEKRDSKAEADGIQSRMTPQDVPGQHSQG
jgi:hypothetical protein